ncbi:MAG: hypothetical protein AB7O56_01210 [Bauldia sp.]
MSQLTLAALIAVAGWLAWKSFGPTRRQAPPAPQPVRPRATQLELDPKTGIYRPIERDRN